MTARLPSLSDMWDTAVYKREGTNIQSSNGTGLLSSHFEVKCLWLFKIILLLDSTFRLNKTDVWYVYASYAWIKARKMFQIKMLKTRLIPENKWRNGIYSDR